MKDLRQSQLSQMHRERRALIEEGVDADKFIARTKQKAYPAGSTHMFALDAVFGPIGSKKENRNAA